MIEKETIQAQYIYSDVEPTLQSLNDIIDICEKFKKEGGHRLLYALSMRHWTLAQVERCSGYLADCRRKMGAELARLRKFQETFNSSFATDHNDYFNSVDILLRQIRSHTSPLKTLFGRTTERYHKPTAAQMEAYQIAPRPVREASVLGNAECPRSLFGIDDPSIPAQVRGLFHELEQFFAAEQECMERCLKVLNEEESIRQDPVLCHCLLDSCLHEMNEAVRSMPVLIEDETIDFLKTENPPYRLSLHCATDEAFAQEGFHKYNKAAMKHFVLIRMYDAQHPCQLDDEEIALWGRQPEVVAQIKYALQHFDELLPPDFRQKLMGRYMYYFCRWALPYNVKGAVAYFHTHYRGSWKLVKYAAVASYALEYDARDPRVADFNQARQTMTARVGTAAMQCETHRAVGERAYGSC